MKRLPAFDLLRALAVVSVMISHFGPASWPIVHALPWGRLGVGIFFVLSGYLITGILLQARQSPEPISRRYRRFIARRALRILPVYIMAIVCTLLLGDADVRQQLLWYATFTENIGTSLLQQPPGRLGHFWTLCVEWQFYLVFPFLIWRLPVNRLPAVLLGLVVTGVALKTATALLLSPLAARPWPVWSNFETLCAGAWFAWVVHVASPAARFALLRAINPAAAIGAICLVALAALHLTWPTGPAIIVEPAYVGGLDAVVALVSLGLVARAAAVTRLPAVCAPLCYLGRISYGFYAYHYLLQADFVQLHNKLFPPIEQLCYAPTGFMVAFIGTMIVAALSWHFMEQPLLQLKDGWLGRDRVEAIAS